MVFIASGRLTRAQAGQDSRPTHSPAPGQAAGEVTPDNAVTSAEEEVTDAVDSDAEPGAMTLTPALVVQEQSVADEAADETIVVEITPVQSAQILTERPLVGRLQRLFWLYGWPLGLTMLLLLATLLTLAAREWKLNPEGFEATGQVQDQALIDNLAAAEQAKVDLEAEIATNQADHEAWMEEYPAQERRKMREQRLQRLAQQEADLAQLFASGSCPDCDLEGADLANKDLAGVNLSGANLNGANLAGSNLQGANLAYASLLGANLYQSQLQGANLYGANLIDANLSQARGLFAEHCRNLRKAARGKGGVDQEFSLSLLENRLLRRESWVQLIANLLVTLGMVGTILGLTGAMQGLASALGSIESSLSLESTQDTSPITGLTLALEGMSTAFVTTLAGAVLGGLLLKALSHFSTNLIEDLLDQIRLKASLEVVPQLERLIWKQEMAALTQAQHNVQAFMNSGREIDQFLKSYTQGLVGASEQLTVLSQKLGDQVFTVKRDSPVEGQQRLEALLSRLEGAAVQQNQLLTRLFYAVCGLAGGGTVLFLLVQVGGGA